MAARHWVGGTASWNGTALLKWSLTSGGVGGEAEPTAADDVFFDAGSGAVTVTIALGNTGCKDLKFVSGAGAFAGTTAGSAAISVSGDFLLSASMTNGYTGQINLISTSAQLITSNGKAFNNNLVLNGVGGSWTLQDALDNGANGQFILTNGTFNLNGFNLSSGTFSSSNSNVRTITSGGGLIQSAYASGTTTVIDVGTITNLTVTNRMTFVLTGNNAAGTRTLSIGVFSEANAPNVTISAGAGAVVFGQTQFNVTFDGTFTGSFSNNTKTIYGNLTLKSGMTVTAGTSVITFGATSGTKTITTAGVTIDSPVTFNGAGGTWQLVDALTIGSTRAMTLTNGTLNANNQNVSIGTFALGSGTKTLTLGSGTWTVAGSGASAWSANTNVTNLTVTASTGKISMTSASAKTFAGGAKSWPTLNQGGTGDLTVTQANTFADIQWSAAGKIILPASTTTTATLFTGPVAVSGTLESSSAGTAATLSKASGVVSVSNLSIKDSTATGGAIFYAFTSNGNTDVSGNSGWIFTGNATVGGNGPYINLRTSIHSFSKYTPLQ